MATSVRQRRSVSMDRRRILDELDSPDSSATKCSESVARVGRWRRLDTVESVASAITKLDRGQDDDRSFYIIDLDDILRKIQLWKKALPRVRPFYAVKCNHDPAVLRLIATEPFMGFDCASGAELDRVDTLNVRADRIVYAHPVKNASYLRQAKKMGVAKMTFDNPGELDKIAEHCPSAELLLRLRVTEGDLVHINDKFGCNPNDVRNLLCHARALGLNVVGFSFHVGLNAASSHAYVHALRLCADAEVLAEEVGFRIRLIDIGGGFNGYIGEESSFEEIAAGVHQGLNIYFPNPSRHEIIAEPGTFFVASSMSLCTKVLGSRMGNDQHEIYINDSVFMSFMYARFYGKHLTAQRLSDLTLYPLHRPGFMPPSKLNSTGRHTQLEPTTVWGNVLAGVDIIGKDWHLPRGIVEGEWLLFHNMGAYTLVAESDFNSFHHPERFYRASSQRVLIRGCK